MSAPTDTSAEAIPVDEGLPAGSILDDLRKTRQRKAEETPRTLVLKITGYGEPSRLAAVYRYPTTGYKAISDGVDVERLSGEEDAQVHGNCDILVACCASLVGRRSDGTLVNIDTDEPVKPEDVIDPAYPGHRFNMALAEKLGITVGDDVERKARFICREVFSPGAQATGRYEGDLNLIAHGNIVFQWLQGIDLERGEEQAGE